MIGCHLVAKQSKQEYKESYMLILNRKEGQAIKLGDHITVTVLARKGTQVKLAITAPRDVAVHREEIYKLIREKEEKGTAQIEACEEAC